MKKRDFVQELKGLSVAELRTRERELSQELMKLRFRKASGQLEEGYRPRQVRRSRAQVKTVLNQKLREASA